MTTLPALLSPLLTQWIPALFGLLAALLCFVVRPGPSRWWGGLAGLALLPLPSVCGTLLTVFSISRFSSERTSAMTISSLLPGLFPLIFGFVVVLICFFPREDPLRRRFSAAVMIGYLARELGYVLLLAGALIVALYFSHTSLF